MLPIEKDPFALSVILILFVGLPLASTIIYYTLLSRFLGSKRELNLEQILSFCLGACMFTAFLAVAWHFAKTWSLESIEDNPANTEQVEQG